MDNSKIGKTVFSAAEARKLLNMGNNIIDIKPNKDNKYKTVFIFEKTDKLYKDLKSL